MRFSKSWSLLWLSALALAVTLPLAGTWVLAYDAPSQTSPPEYWVAQATTALPLTIEPDDIRWEETTPLYLPVHAGSHGPLTDQVVELMALYDPTTIAFRARWSGPTPADEKALDQARDRFALIWHKDDLPGQRGEDCGTACHLAQSDDDGRIRAVVPSFVPAGREEPLPSQAVWRDGAWTLTWSRPLRSPEARDIQFVDLSQRYRVRAKVFLDLKHKPDLLTEDTYLIFN